MGPDEAFHSWVDQRIAERLRAGSRTFSDLLYEVASVYPTELLHSLDRLEAAGGLGPMFRRSLVSGSQPPCPMVEEPKRKGAVVLPVPHPLDYDWRFTDRSVDRLLALVEAESATAQVLFLGAPSVFARSMQRDARRDVLLIDSNPLLQPLFETLGFGASYRRIDVTSDPLPALQAAAAILDPPWYPEEMRSFLWTGRQMVVPGGIMWISLPPPGTRPGIEGERASLLAWAERAGLRLRSIEPLALRYVTPPFERNALKAAGVSCVPGSWRAGDLAAFEVAAECGETRPLLPRSTPEWDEVVLGGIRVRVRTRTVKPATGDPRLVPLIGGDVLPSVSRRHPERDRVGVWTSGNRVFECGDGERLSRLLRSCESARSSGDLSAQDRQALEQVEQVVHLEEEEYGAAWMNC